MANPKNLEQRTRAVSIICPVKSISSAASDYLASLVSSLERDGYRTHYVPGDSNIGGKTGLDACLQSRDALKKSRQVLLYWLPESRDIRFYIGMSFMAKKPFGIINKNDVTKTCVESFENFLLEFEGLYSSLKMPQGCLLYTSPSPRDS